MLSAIAERAAAIVLEQIDRDRSADSPWLDVEGAIAYLGFSRHRLYKLTAARAIPFHKKRGGQRLLFRRKELDRWVETSYLHQGRAA